MEANKLREMIYESLMTELHKKGHEDPKGRELMKGEEDLDEYNAMNKMSDYEEKEGPVKEGRPAFQKTPDAVAYKDFKKWAQKNEKAVKGILVKAVEGGRDAGTDTFLALRQVWLAWANKNAKEHSRIPNKGPEGKGFGRALAVMMKKDNLIIAKSTNKLTDLNEGKLTEAVYDNILKAIPDNYSYKALAKDVATIIKDAYGSHNIKPFIKELASQLKEAKLEKEKFTEPGQMRMDEAGSLWKRFDMLQDMRMDSMDLEDDMRGIAWKLSQTHKDMEQEAEPEGGPKATKYGKDIAKLETEYKKKKAEFKKIMAKIDKLEQF